VNDNLPVGVVDACGVIKNVAKGAIVVNKLNGNCRFDDCDFFYKI
jgi:hypothetical protein